MISAKGKHNFWSHLLLSMIAIFALPTTQGAEHQHNNGENYQSQQVQQQILRAVSLKRQTQIQPNLQGKSAVSFTKIFLFSCANSWQSERLLFIESICYRQA